MASELTSALAEATGARHLLTRQWLHRFRGRDSSKFFALLSLITGLALAMKLHARSRTRLQEPAATMALSIPAAAQTAGVQRMGSLLRRSPFAASHLNQPASSLRGLKPSAIGERRSSPQLFTFGPRTSPSSRLCRSTACLANPRRVAKVGRQIEREMGQMLLFDNRLRQAVCPERKFGLDLGVVASVSTVILSSDMQVAKVYISFYSDEEGKRSAMDNLKKLEGYARKEVAKVMGLRLAPIIKFFEDDTMDQFVRVQKLLNEVEQRNKTRALPFEN